MSRIFKGSESTLKLLIGKNGEHQTITDIKITLYTTDVDSAIKVIDGIVIEGDSAIINLAPRAFMGMEDGVINYAVDGLVDGKPFHTERQSNYYLKTLSYISEDGVASTTLSIKDNGEYKITPNDGLYVDVNVDIPIQKSKSISVSKNNATSVIKADDEFAGMEEINVTINVPIQKSKQVTLTDNTTYTIKKDDDYDGVEEVDVTVEVPLQEKAVTFSRNATYSIQPDQDYKGITNIEVEVDVPVPVLEESVNVKLQPGDTGALMPTEGYDAMKKVNYTVSETKGKIKTPNGICFSGSTFEEFDGSNWDWSLVYDCAYMFRSCNNLKSVTNLNVKPITCDAMFSGCTNLENIDFTQMDLSEVVEIRNMFAGCRSLKSLDLSLFDASKIIDWTNVIDGCSSLTELDATVFTQNNKILSFSGCSGLTHIHGLELYRGTGITTFRQVFAGCASLTEVDLSNWDNSEVYDMWRLFENCKSLTKITMGGNPKSLKESTAVFSGVAPNGTFYYNEKYDYSVLINMLHPTWTAVPIKIDNGL